MKNLNNSKVYYRCLVIVLSAVLIAGLMYLLDWPVVAEVTLGVSIFLQSHALSGILFEIWKRQEKHSVHELMGEIARELAEGEKSREENPSYNHH